MYFHRKLAPCLSAFTSLWVKQLSQNNGHDGLYWFVIGPGLANQSDVKLPTQPWVTFDLIILTLKILVSCISWQWLLTVFVVMFCVAGQSVPGRSILLNNSLSDRLPLQASKGIIIGMHSIFTGILHISVDWQKLQNHSADHFYQILPTLHRCCLSLCMSHILWFVSLYVRHSSDM